MRQVQTLASKRFPCADSFQVRDGKAMDEIYKLIRGACGAKEKHLLPARIFPNTVSPYLTLRCFQVEPTSCACTWRAMMGLDTEMNMEREQAPAYPVLAELLQGDERKVKAILRIFHRSVSKDLLAIERAAAGGRWFVVLRLAHRISIGCRQIGEECVAEEFMSEVVPAIDSARTRSAATSSDFMCRFRCARHRLAETLARAAAYAAIDEFDSVA